MLFPFICFPASPPKFLSAISAVVCRGTLGCLISAPRPRSPQLSTQERERGRQPRTITSPVTAATSLAIASLTEAVFHHISAIAQRQLACFSQWPTPSTPSTPTPRLRRGQRDPPVLLARLRHYLKLSVRMKTALLFGLGERARLSSAFRRFEARKSDSTEK